MCFIIVIHIPHFTTYSSFLHFSFRRFLTLNAPSSRFVSSGPFLLDITQSLLDLVHGIQVAGVLANIVANLDRRTAGGRGDLDDDVERCGLRAGGKMGEVICDGSAGSTMIWGLDAYLSRTSQYQMSE